MYRTVQEALTNTARSAGRGASARVGVSWTDDGVEVEIVDSGGSAFPTVASDGSVGSGGPVGSDGSVGSGGPVGSGGYGLTGIAERAALLGGHAQAGPVDGGFRVHLRLPLVPSPPQPNHQESPT